MSFIFNLILINLIIIFISINNINCITKDDLKNIETKINADTIENKVNKIIKEYTEFNDRYE